MVYNIQGAIPYSVGSSINQRQDGKMKLAVLKKKPT